MNFVLMAIVVLSVASCAKCDLEQVVAGVETEETFTLYAEIETLDTKADLAYDDDANTISIDWIDSGDDIDEITLYNSDSLRVGNFKCSDSATSAFVAIDGAVLAEGDYTAVFPATESETLADAQSEDLTSSQNGDAISSLNNACYMEGVFTYVSGENSTVRFNHKMAVMTFIMEDKQPKELVFANGDDAYTVTFTDAVEPLSSGYYRSHIMIKPCSDYFRMLSFAITYSDDSKKVYTVTSGIEYQAGMNYTAPFTTISNPTDWVGDGTSVSPYLIETAGDLRNLSSYVSEGNSYSGVYFTLTSDIDLEGIDGDQGVAEKAFTPIGSSSTKFCGKFYGNGKTISGLYTINGSSDNQGLFGYISDGAEVSDITVYGKVSGANNTAGIVGNAENSAIFNCLNNVEVVGNHSDVVSTYYPISGGVVGNSNNSTITNCYNSAQVTGVYYVGGIVGYNTNNSIVVNCGNTARVESGYYVGGIAGANASSSLITVCFSSGEVVTTHYPGGISGYNDKTTSTISYSHYDTGVCGFIHCAYGHDAYDDGINGCYGYTTSRMQSYLSYALNNYAYYYNEGTSIPVTKACAWNQVDGDYPTLNIGVTPSSYIYSDWTTDQTSFTGGDGSEDDPYQISTVYDLVLLSQNVNSGIDYSGKYFIQKDNITLEGKTFTAIGNYDNRFEGVYDGNYNVISGLYINNSDDSGQALFGYISHAEIKNTSVSGQVTGGNYVAGIVGYAQNSTINYCNNYVTVSSVKSNANVGGVVGIGYDGSLIINCSNKAVVSGGDNAFVGGIVGYANSSVTVANNYNNAAIGGGSSANVGGIAGVTLSTTLINCFNTALVTTTSNNGYIGGVVGYNDYGSTITCSYFNATIFSDGSIAGYNAYGATIADDCKGMAAADMIIADFADTLGLNRINGILLDSGLSRSLYDWIYNEGSYPTLNSSF